VSSVYLCGSKLSSRVKDFKKTTLPKPNVKELIIIAYIYVTFLFFNQKTKL